LEWQRPSIFSRRVSTLSLQPVEPFGDQVRPANNGLSEADCRARAGPAEACFTDRIDAAVPRPKKAVPHCSRGRQNTSAYDVARSQDSGVSEGHLGAVARRCSPKVVGMFEAVSASRTSRLFFKGDLLRPATISRRIRADERLPEKKEERKKERSRPIGPDLRGCRSRRRSPATGVAMLIRRRYSTSGTRQDDGSPRAEARA